MTYRAKIHELYKKIKKRRFSSSTHSVKSWWFIRGMEVCNKFKHFSTISPKLHQLGQNNSGTWGKYHFKLFLEVYSNIRNLFYLMFDKFAAFNQPGYNQQNQQAQAVSQPQASQQATPPQQAYLGQPAASTSMPTPPTSQQNYTQAAAPQAQQVHLTLVI